MKSTNELQEKVRERARAKMTTTTLELKRQIEREIRELLRELQVGTLDANKLKVKVHKVRKKVKEMPNHDI